MNPDGGPSFLVMIGIVAVVVATVILIFVVLTWYSALIGVSIWIGVVGLLRMMAKADPQMSRIYLRHIAYRAYYPPRSRPARGAR